MLTPLQLAAIRRSINAAIAFGPVDVLSCAALRRGPPILGPGVQDWVQVKKPDEPSKVNSQ